MRVNKKGYVQNNGEKIVVGSGVSRLHKIACCDCGLVHVFKFRLEGSAITFKAYRDNRATAQRRRLEHEYVAKDGVFRMKRNWIRVGRSGQSWQVKFSHCIDGFSALDPFKSKAKAIDAAYRWAKKLKPCKVRIFSAAGKLQVDYLVTE